MCKYCEKQPYWKQPFFEGMPERHKHCDGCISSNVWSEAHGGLDWKVKIYDYKTCQPVMSVVSENFAKALWGSGIANIQIPIHYCPFCGEKLGKKDKKEVNANE